jgi:hypothetical protein
MLARIAGFELRYQLRSPLFFISFALFFLMTFGSVTSEHIQIGARGNVNLNSPFAILTTLTILSLFSLFVVTAFVANIVLRDQETGFAPILYTTRLRKSEYLIGRFLGAIAVAFLLLAAVPLAIMVGATMPWLDHEKVGPFVLTHYVYALFVFGLPVLLVSGACLFALATATRSMMGSYIGLTAALVLYIIVQTAFSDPAYDHVTALLDPFGLGALEITTKYWTIAERNTQLPPLSGELLLNRALWLGVGAVMFAVAYALFRFEARSSAVRTGPAPDREAGAPGPAVRHAAPEGRPGWAAFGAMTRLEMRTIFLSPGFLVLLCLGVLNSFGGLVATISQRDVSFLPVTRAIVVALDGSFTLFPIIIAIFYGGELVWRDRERRIHEIVDACPAPSWTMLLPKLLALSMVLLATLAAAVLTGMAFQLGNGYMKLEPLHYLLWFFVPNAVVLIQMAVLAVVVQSVVPHRAIGWAVMLVYVVLNFALPSLGFEHGLYLYGYRPVVPLSDMNGMGRFWIAQAWYELYWSAFATILVVLSLALWRRGTETRFLPRLALLPRQLAGAPGAVMGLAGAVLAGSGAFIYYNTVILNDYARHTAIAEERFSAALEKTLLRYESVPQPKTVGVQLDVQLFPRQTRAETSGSYLLENRTQQPIAQLHVHWDRRLQMLQLDPGPATLEKDFPDLQYRIYRLITPMAPGEQRTLRFATRLEERGFPNRSPLTRIVENGTFLDNTEIAPTIGIGRESFLKDRSMRRRNGLQADLRPPKLEDQGASAFPAYLRSADWAKADLSVTTDADQTPLAPGYTVSDRVKDGRRTLVTHTEAPIMPFFSIQSARYTIAHDLWQAKDGSRVNLEVYYHADHPYNVERIIKAMKASLDVFSERFGPYQFRQARILEFPGYARFAQSFANTIPFSESIGFVQKFDDKAADSIDEVTFVTAHELGHQWWGHQVLGANKQGWTMLSETFAQYSALLVMEKLYGHEQIRKFLKSNLDDYLRNRGGEVVEELPLERVEDQPYIHYRKGALVMYWLKESLGQDVVDRALRRLLATYAFKAAPYPSTTDFLAFVQQEAGPGHEKLINDLFASITLYDMKAKDAVAHRRADGHYEVRFTVEGKKLYADALGKETEVSLDEPFDVGAFSVEPGKKGYTSGSVLKVERLPVKGGTQILTLLVDKLPKLVGIDPFNERIDRTSDDNFTAVKLE